MPTKKSKESLSTITSVHSQKSTIIATDFVAMQAFFQPKVAALYAVDHGEAASALDRLAKLILKYGRRVEKRDATSDLGIYLYGRNRPASAIDKNVYELSLELAMPGEFPLYRRQHVERSQ